MLRKFVEAIRLFCTNFVLFASIILTVWLPGNLLAEYLIWYVPSDDEFGRSFRVGALIEGVFGPIYCGALVYALAQLKRVGGRATSTPSPSGCEPGVVSSPRGSSQAYGSGSG